MKKYTLPSLRYLRLRFHFIALTDCRLPPWKGSLIRGAYGHALRRTVCTMDKTVACKDCMLRTQCAYTRLFETLMLKPPPPFLKGLPTTPRPFIFEPLDDSETYHEGDTLWFDMLLIGEAVQFLPYVVFSVYQMGNQGLGTNRHPFQLGKAYCWQPQPASPENKADEFSDADGKMAHPAWHLLYDGATQCIVFTPEPVDMKKSTNPGEMPGTVNLKFTTETRLKFRNELTVDFTFRMLVFKMLRRILELAYFYMPEEEPHIDWEFRDLLDAADRIKITSRNLHWHDQERYSSRQKAHLKMGGFIGDLTLRGDLTPFMELLAYAEVMHVGKGATFGLGKFLIER